MLQKQQRTNNKIIFVSRVYKRQHALICLFGLVFVILLIQEAFHWTCKRACVIKAKNNKFIDSKSGEKQSTLAARTAMLQS